MSCRHPAAAATTTTAPMTAIALPLIVNGRDLPRSQRFEEAARALDVELRIARLDAQEEPVAAGQCEARHVEDRVIWLRQPVQRQHTEDGCQRRPENGALEGD